MSSSALKKTPIVEYRSDESIFQAATQIDGYWRWIPVARASSSGNAEMYLVALLDHLNRGRVDFEILRGTSGFDFDSLGFSDGTGTAGLGLDVHTEPTLRHLQDL